MVMGEPSRWQRVLDVFDGALARPSDERAAFLDQACAADQSLHADVLKLLVADEQARAAGFLTRPPLAAAGGDLVGRRIGPYRLLTEIGRGGMGVVFRATREDDVFHKTVAVKVVQGNAGTEALRRFARERRILARLQHPNIAAILDGGET